MVLKYPKISLFELNLILNKNYHQMLLDPWNQPIEFLNICTSLFKIPSNECIVLKGTATKYESLMKESLSEHQLKDFIHSNKYMQLLSTFEKYSNELKKQYDFWKGNDTSDIPQ